MKTKHILLIIIISILLFTSCRQADRVSHNVSREASGEAGDLQDAADLGFGGQIQYLDKRECRAGGHSKNGRRYVQKALCVSQPVDDVRGGGCQRG